MKIHELIRRSVFLRPEQKEHLMKLLKTMLPEEKKELRKILASEKTVLRKIFKQWYKKDPSCELIQKFFDHISIQKKETATVAKGEAILQKFSAKS